MTAERIRARRTLSLHRLAITAAAPALTLALAIGSGQAQAAGRVGSRPAPGDIATVMGGVGGPGPATAIPLGYEPLTVPDQSVDAPCGIAFSGALYIGDGVVRKVNAQTDHLTTQAGNFLDGPAGNGGPATSAALVGCGVTFDHNGNLLIADRLNDMVRVVAATTGTFYGQPMTAGNIYTIAGGGNGGFNGPAIGAFLSGDPEAVAVDGHGNVILVEQANGGGDKLAIVATSTGTFYRTKMVAGDIYKLAGIARGFVTGDGGPARAAGLGSSVGELAVDKAGNLVLADTAANRIRVIAASTGTFYGQRMTDGNIYTIAGTGTPGFAGDGGPAIAAEVMGPTHPAVDGAGNLIFSDMGTNRVRVVAEGTGTFYGVPMTAGDIYTVAGDGSAGFSGDGGPATEAELNRPGNVAVTGAGDLLIPDLSNNRIREVAG